MKVPRTARLDTLSLAVLVSTLCAYFLPWITLKQAFFQVDIAFMDHPLRFHAAQMLRSGTLPLWSDHILAGFPLFAEGQAAILYPFSWLYLVLPPETALNAFVVLHYQLLGCFSYGFMRARPLSPPAALFGALTLVLSSFMLVEHVLMPFLSVVAWLPLLLWQAERFVRTGSRGSLVLAAVCAGLMHLAGDPLGTLLSLAASVAFVVAGSSTPTYATRRKAAVVLAIGVLGAALAAIQLLPSREFLAHSTRSAVPGAPPAAFLPLESVITAVFPRFFGGTYSGYFGADYWEERLLFFVGWVPLFLLPFGIGRGRASHFWALLAAAGLALSLRCCLPVSGFVWSVPPLGWFRWPGRALLWYALGLSVLGAMGFERLRDRSALGPALRWRLAGVAALALAALASYATLASSLPDAAGRAQVTMAEVLGWRAADMGWFVGVWGVLLALVGSWRGRRIGSRVLTGTLLAGLIVGQHVQPGPEGVAPDILRAAPETARFLSASLGPRARVLPLTPWGYPESPTDAPSLRGRFEALAANAHLRFGLWAVAQFDLAHTAALRRSREALLDPSEAVLDLLGVSAFVTPPGLGALPRYLGAHSPARPWPLRALTARGYERCFETRGVVVHCRSQPAPRAFLVRDHRVLEGAHIQTMLAAGDALDLRKTVLLEEAPQWPAEAADRFTARRLRDEVVIVRDEPGHVEIEVASRGRALLVLADTHYPGWRAELDGEKSNILVANGFVRALPVGPGRHAVSFRYRPASLRVGAAISFLALLGLLGYAARATRKTRALSRGARENE